MELVVLYINKITGGMRFRSMHNKAIKSDNEIFMAILSEKDAATICNRFNNEIWKG